MTEFLIFTAGVIFGVVALLVYVAFWMSGDESDRERDGENGR